MQISRTPHRVSFRACSTAVTLVLLACFSVACGSSPTGHSSPSPAESPAELDTRRFPAAGYAIGIPATWQVHSSRLPASAGWQMNASPATSVTGLPDLTVVVSRSAASYEPEAFQADEASRLNWELSGITDSASVRHRFEPASVNGVPALMAAYSQSFESEASIEFEWYVLGSGDREYSIRIGAPMAEWETAAPALREMVKSFSLLE